MKSSKKSVLVGLMMVLSLTFGSAVFTNANILAAVDCKTVTDASSATDKAACPCNTNIKGNITAAKGAECSKSTDQKADLFGDSGIFKTITNTALFIIGALSVIMLIYGGIRYTVSMGDAKNVEAAKNTIMYAIIGIVVALLAYAIVNFVLGALITT